MELFLANYPNKSRFAEAFRTLHTNIQFSFMENEFRVLLVTSPGEKEGKTSTVANLAFTMAGAGKRVLMIDGDLRKPMLSRLFASRKSPGLTGILSGVFGADIRDGSLADFNVSDLIRLMILQKKTGFLHLNHAAERMDLVFVQGVLKDLNWLTRPEGKKLASVLMKNEILDREDVKRAIARQKTTGRKLGHILLTMGLLQEEDLKGVLNGHMKEGLRVALQLKEGSFEFKEVDKADFEQASFDPVDFHQLYDQLVIGEEEIPFLYRGINDSIRRTGVDNLYLLPSGDLPPNPTELLGSDRLSFLISILKKRFDLLIIDSAPILPASDALLLAPLADGVLLMVRSGLMNRELVKKVVEQLRNVHANLLGLALNQVDFRKEGYYKDYYSYYSKYYGESS